MGHSRTKSYHAGTSGRPMTSQAQYPAERAYAPDTAPIGTVPHLIATPTTLLSLRKRRQRQVEGSVQPGPRISSFVGKKHSQRVAPTANSSTSNTPAPSRETSITTALRRMRLDDRDARREPRDCKSDDTCIKTPSQIPRLAQTPTPSLQAAQQQKEPRVVAFDIFERPPSPPKSPTKSTSRSAPPVKLQFLNKSSNLSAPIELDANNVPWSDPELASKLTSIESYLEQFKTQMQGTHSERGQYKEIIDLMKSKSRFRSLRGNCYLC